MLKELMTNKVFLTLIIAGLLTQGLKVLIIFLQGRKIMLKDLIATGGMPSSHSALTTSLTAIIYFIDGISTSFFVSLVLAVIVIRDAFGIRRAIGEDSLMLHKIAKHLKMQEKIHYTLGHTPLQVLVGCLLGFAVAMIVYLW